MAQLNPAFDLKTCIISMEHEVRARLGGILLDQGSVCKKLSPHNWIRESLPFAKLYCSGREIPWLYGVIDPWQETDADFVFSELPLCMYYCPNLFPTDDRSDVGTLPSNCTSTDVICGVCLPIPKLLEAGWQTAYLTGLQILYRTQRYSPTPVAVLKAGTHARHTFCTE